jgi:hypothetical protein
MELAFEKTAYDSIRVYEEGFPEKTLGDLPTDQFASFLFGAVYSRANTEKEAKMMIENAMKALSKGPKLS